MEDLHMFEENNTLDLVDYFEIENRRVSYVEKIRDYLRNDIIEIDIGFEDGKVLRFYHDQDCCERVRLYDVDNDLDNLVDGIILNIYEVKNSKDHLSDVDSESESFTWTFYRIVSDKGYFVMRWFGTSSGYYSEEVDVEYET